ncbi:diguanylate cyclase [Actinoplanes sp. NPDC051851]|uniref:GGDEF domain-containing protein n=1 Tax=Actinoplanes sp. NPDC051851 TaxID=3154753 RepID=UPI00341429B2
MDAEGLSAILLDIEDERAWNARAVLAQTLEIERAARVLGDELLAVRARLCQIHMRMRAGDVAAAADQIWRVYEWAAEHGERRLQARTHLVWAAIHQHLGDAEQALEQSLLAVELLGDAATDHMRIWHRTKLADAFWAAGSMDEARARYSQAEELAVQYGSPALICLLNNRAFNEFDSGDQNEAQTTAERMEKLAAERGIPLEPAYLDTLGAIQVGNGQYATAEETLLLCIARNGEGHHDDADALPEYLVHLAQAQRGLGAYDRAQASLDTSRRLCEERGLGEMLVRVHQEQSELHAARGDFATAFATHKLFFTEYQNLQSLQREARTRTRQAMFETREAREEAERFREQARRDPLTGLRNRRFVDEQLPALIDADPALSVAMVDLDHFKQINDRFSHAIGDQVLVRVADLLTREVNRVCPDGFVARMGGEEFLVVLPGTGLPRAAAVLEDIRHAVRRHPWTSLTRDLPVTVSIGVAGLCDTPVRSQPRLLSTADSHLYAAKHGGRDRVVSTIDLHRSAGTATAA